MFIAMLFVHRCVQRTMRRVGAQGQSEGIQSEGIQAPTAAGQSLELYQKPTQKPTRRTRSAAMAEAAAAGVPGEQPPAGQQARQTLARVESVAGLAPVTLAHEGSTDENSGTQQLPAQLCGGGAQVGQPSSSSRQAQPTRRVAAAPVAQQLPVKVSVYLCHVTPQGTSLNVLPCCQHQLQSYTLHAIFQWTAPKQPWNWQAMTCQYCGGAAHQSQQLVEPWNGNLANLTFMGS